MRSIICDALLAVCILWGLASVLTIAIKCPILSLMGYQGEFCTGVVGSILDLSVCPGRCPIDALMNRSHAGKLSEFLMLLPR